MTLAGNPNLTDPGFNDPPKSPLMLLQRWLTEAERLKIQEPRGMVLSTVDRFGHPSSRVVLLKSCDEKGAIFATSQESAKGQDLALNPWAAATLWWRETVQQINFRGPVIMLSKEKSDEIFHERAREAQAITAVSKQSAPLINQSDLKEKVQQLMNTKGEIKRPVSWHAYCLIIESIEFWHGSSDRCHQRLHYHLVDAVWRHARLQP